MSSASPTTYKITLPASSTWSGTVDNTTGGGGSTIWIGNPYPYEMYYDISIGTSTTFSPLPNFSFTCGDTFKWDERREEFVCQSCNHSQKRHVKNHHGESDHCRECVKPETKELPGA